MNRIRVRRRRVWRFSLLLLTLALAMGIASAKPAYAATLTVDCATDANALGTALASATDGDTLAIQGTCKGTFEVAHSLTLEGSGGATLDGQGAGTVLSIDSGQTVAVKNLTVTNGLAFVGGGVINQGTLTLSNSTVSGNSTSFAGEGGGILNGGSGTMTLTNSTVSGNTASFAGGISNGGQLTLNQSAVSGNSGNPGGVFNFSSASVTLNNSTLSFNTGSGLQNGEQNVSGGGSATLKGSTVSGNSGPYAGITNSSTLTVANSTISGNSSSFAAGGGVANTGGTLTLSNSTVSGNTAATFGGGIANTGNGNATVTESTISDNNATSGGGLDNEPSSLLTLTNDTITGNSASDSGGGIDVTGFSTLTLKHDTITGNSANVSGGGISVTGVTATVVESTIVADQTAGGNCADTIPDGGYNLDDGASCGFSSANNSLSNTDPLLDPAGLHDNGGPTQTIALEPGSPAIDAIPPTVNGCGTTITTDQRGVSRPQGPGCDMGAFEVAPPGVDLSITKSGAPNPVVSGNRLTYTIAVTNNGPQDATGVTVTDALPASLHFNSVSSSQGTCTRSTVTSPQPKGGTVTCSVGNLANGAKARITIVVTATTPGAVTNTAKVNGNETDPDSSNNSATATTNVMGT